MQIINKFITELKAEQALVVESMVTGNFANFESYQRYVGQHQGLQEALNIINNLLEEDENVEK